MIQKLHKTIVSIGLMVCMVFISGCSCKPILYKPTDDPSSIVLSLNVHEKVTSLSLFPRDRTIVEKGVHKETGGRAPDEIEEMIDLFTGSGSSTFLGTQYRVTLYRNEDAAKRGYEFWRRAALPLEFPPFREDRGEKWAYYLTHIRRPREDIEGFCRPMSYYESQIIFRLRNLVVFIEARHKDINSDLLVSSVKYFSEQLEKTIDGTGIKGQPEK